MFSKSYCVIALAAATSLGCACDDEPKDSPSSTGGTTGAGAGGAASAGTGGGGSQSSGGATGPGSSGGASGSGGSPECGDTTCDAQEDCRSCEVDCGACPDCEAPSCTGAGLPPGNLTPRAEWDLSLNRIAGDALARHLDEQIDRHPAAVAVIVAWISGTVLPDEPRTFTRIREVLAENPAVREGVRRHIEDRVGSLDHLPSTPEGISPPIHTLASPGGNVVCGDPFLRIRLASLDVVEEDDDLANDKVYCVIRAESTVGEEVRLTAPTSPLNEGESRAYSLADGLVWGIEGPKDPVGSLLVTYDCFEQEADAAWTALASSLGDALTELAPGVPGPGKAYVAAAGAAASIIGQAIALDADDHLLNAQQTLAPTEYLPAMIGTSWNVTRSGTNLNSLWTWRLNMELWGCAELGQ